MADRPCGLPHQLAACRLGGLVGTLQGSTLVQQHWRGRHMPCACMSSHALCMHELACLVHHDASSASPASPGQQAAGAAAARSWRLQSTRCGTSPTTHLRGEAGGCAGHTRYTPCMLHTAPVGLQQVAVQWRQVSDTSPAVVCCSHPAYCSRTTQQGNTPANQQTTPEETGCPGLKAVNDDDYAAAFAHAEGQYQTHLVPL